MFIQWHCIVTKEGRDCCPLVLVVTHHSGELKKIIQIHVCKASMTLFVVIYTWAAGAVQVLCEAMGV